MKNLKLVILISIGITLPGSIIVITACSVDMLDYLQNKIVLDEISYREMVSVAGGSYLQDDGTNDFDHTISGFKIGKYEVTYVLWYTVQNWALSNGYTFANPGVEGNNGTPGAYPSAAKHEPVTNINWRDAIVWCNAYSEMSGCSPVYYTNSGYTSPLKTSTNDDSDITTPGSEDNPYVNWSANGYRLPTEGEWQFAASNRGGTTYDFASGAILNTSNAIETQEVAWYDLNSGLKTNAVGTTIKSSALTLWDMSGNVWEWCWDVYGTYPAGPESDYKGLDVSANLYRALRGGGWDNSAISMEIGNRYNHYPHNDDSPALGLRLVTVQ